MKLRLFVFLLAVSTAFITLCSPARADDPTDSPAFKCPRMILCKPSATVNTSICRSLPRPDIDSDGDGLTNYEECMLGLNPRQNNPDSDGDGLPDAWEVKHFGLCLGFDGDDDPDQDGVSNAAEYKSGCMQPYVCDSDQDDKMDGEEDSNHNGVVDDGETNPCESNNDGHADNTGGGSTCGRDGLIGAGKTLDIYYEYDQLGRIKKIVRGAQE